MKQNKKKVSYSDILKNEQYKLFHIEKWYYDKELTIDWYNINNDC